MEISATGHPIIDIVLPTYRMEPEETEKWVCSCSVSFDILAANAGILGTRFYPSKAKEIADKIIEEELNGAVYDDQDAKSWSVIISDKVREKVTGK